MFAEKLKQAVSGMSAVVTAGSTIGQIDAVRYTEEVGFGVSGPHWKSERFEMQNPFKGALGLRIAEAMERLGMRVRLLTRSDLLSGFKHELRPESIRDFRTFEELESRLPDLLDREKPDFVWQAAAVSDWVPYEIEGVETGAREGKIESSAKVLKVLFRQTPKLIDRIRGVVGEKSVIIGFKLAVNVTEDHLAALGSKQMKRAGSNYCVGNDFGRITKTCHPVFLYDRSGGRRYFAGTKEESANWLVSTVLGESLESSSM